MGTRAPDINAPAPLAGQKVRLWLQDAPKNGPVVLCLFVSALTLGSTAEAHEFAALRLARRRIVVHAANTMTAALRARAQQ